RVHEIVPRLVPRFWADVATRFSVPLLIGPFYLVGRAFAGDRRRAVFYGVVVSSMIGMAWASQATVRGGRNVELPAYAALSILFALGLHEALKHLGSPMQFSRVARTYVAAAAIGQFAIVVYNPRLPVPYRSDMSPCARLTQ